MLSNIDDFQDERPSALLRVQAERLNIELDEDIDVEVEPTGLRRHQLPKTQVDAKRAAEAERVAAARLARANRHTWKLAAPANDSKIFARDPRNQGAAHSDLMEYLSVLAWWRFMQNPPDAEMPVPSNDNARPLSVPDRNPLPKMTEDELVSYLPKEVQAVMLGSSKQWKPDFKDPTNDDQGVHIVNGRIFRLGGLQFAIAHHSAFEFIRIEGSLRSRRYDVDVGSLTGTSRNLKYYHPVGQDVGRTRPEEGAAALQRAADSRSWFCSILGAVAALPQKEHQARRIAHKKASSWVEFWEKHPHLHGTTPFAESRAKSGLAASEKRPAGLPYKPEPGVLFWGMQIPSYEPQKSHDPDDAKKKARSPFSAGYGIEQYREDRDAELAFRATNAQDAKVLDSSMTAGSMSDLVASNDNGTGNRHLVRAAKALKSFLAA